MSLSQTPIRSIVNLSKLNKLKRLRLTETEIDDLAPLQDMTLEGLSIEFTRVRDLTPIASMTSLQDSAVIGRRERYRELGLSFERSQITNVSPFHLLAIVEQPTCTVETINEVRRQIGLPVHVPEGYVAAGGSLLNEGEGSEEDKRQLVQKPASHSFAFVGKHFEAQPQIFLPRHPDIAADIHNEIRAKASEIMARLAACNAPRRLAETVERLSESLGTSVIEVRAGILQMRFRSLEANVICYDSEDARRELPDDALAMLRDLSSSVEDLMGCFPQLADIEAERLVQRIKDADVPQLIMALSEIRQVSEESDAVAASAIEALRAGEPELQHDSEIIESLSNETARRAALNARDRTLGYMLLVYRNFVAGVVKTGGELTDLGAETWVDFRQKAPQELSNAGIALVVATLVNGLLGPTAAVGAFAASFRPLRDRAKQVADMFMAMKKSARSSENRRGDANEVI